MFKAVTALKLSWDTHTDRHTDTHTDTAFYSLGCTNLRTIANVTFGVFKVNSELDTVIRETSTAFTASPNKILPFNSSVFSYYLKQSQIINLTKQKNSEHKS